MFCSHDYGTTAVDVLPKQPGSLDHLVGKRKQLRRYPKTERL
jgi:hypothetical protein